jgi:hypothetical protein
VECEKLEGGRLQHDRMIFRLQFVISVLYSFIRGQLKKKVITANCKKLNK